MQFMLDVDTVCLLLKRNANVIAAATRHLGSWCVSSLVYQELMAGQISIQESFEGSGLEEFLKVVDVVPFSQADAQVAAEFGVSAKKVGLKISTIEIQIAAHAASGGLTLVTNSSSSFDQLAGVHNISWVD